MPALKRTITGRCGHDYERLLTGSKRERDDYARWWQHLPCPTCQERYAFH